MPDRLLKHESPGYPGALDATARAGGQPLVVERDAGGLRIDRLKPLLERQRVHAVYLAPSCNNPTGSRTAPHRRGALAALAADHELTVIEDTVLDDLRFDADPGPPYGRTCPSECSPSGR